MVLLLVIPFLNLLFKRVVAERVGTILLSALIAHSAWHWMMERGALLSQYQIQMPLMDAQFFAGLMRWGMLAIVAAAAIWGMYELFRRFGAIGPILGNESSVEER